MEIKKDFTQKRQEIKFLVDKKYFFDLQLKKKIKKLFPSRIINSIYFDTVSLNFFHDSEEGISPRKKVRIRYYNTDFKDLNLEIKHTDSYWRTKYIKRFNINEFSNSLIAKETREIALIPKTKISYLRNYYSCEIGRITLDTDVNCERIYSTNNALKKENTSKIKILDNDKVVLELKTSNKYSKYEATKFFRQRDTRMSKYCEAIKKLF